MGTRLWLALLVCLGSASGAQALPIILSLPVTVTELSDWENNPYPPPNELAIGDTGTITYRFDSEDLVLGPAGCSGCFGDVTMSVSPWFFQGTFPGASLGGFGGANPSAGLRINLTDGAIDVLRIDAVEDDFSFHTLVLSDPTGTAFSASDLLSPTALLANLDTTRFSAMWQLDTQPGAIARAEGAIPEPSAVASFALGVWILARRIRISRPD
jgi:hypothetical protein